MIPALLLLSCNRAPVDYRDVGIAPGAKYPWAGPTDRACERRDETDDPIDGFYFCASDEAVDIVPVDDPLYEPCDDPSLAAFADDVFLTAFDGVRAGAWRIDDLLGRELVHEDWGDEPLLVDY